MSVKETKIFLVFTGFNFDNLFNNLYSRITSLRQLLLNRKGAQRLNWLGRYVYQRSWILQIYKNTLSGGASLELSEAECISKKLHSCFQ